MRGEKPIRRFTAGMVITAMLTGTLGAANALPAYGNPGGIYKGITVSPGEPSKVTGIRFPSEVRLADYKASAETAELYAYLKGVGESSYVLYGHQNDTHHKGGGTYEGSTVSDTKDLTGSISGIVGIDTLSFTGAELKALDGKKDSVDEAAALSIQAALEGGIITLSAHMPNFALVAEKGTDKDGVYDYSGYSPGVTTGNVMDKILPGGELNKVYNGYLDLIARYGLTLEAKGIPVLFRPLHENNGSWFWWGAAYCDEEAYKNVYRYTVEYLRDVKGVHNFLYVYSPNGPFKGIEDYESRYPGDNYVDVVAFDMYHDNPKAQDTWMESFRDTVSLVEEVAAKHGKIPTVSETGMRVTTSLGDGKNYGGIAPYGNQRLNWFSEVGDVLSASKMPYFMVWANFDGIDNFFAPYKVDQDHGHEMADDFIRFYNSSKTIFADGTNFYGKVSPPSVKSMGLSGYFLTPVSSHRMNKPASVRASLSGKPEAVSFVLRNEDGSKKITLEAKREGYTGGLNYIYSAKVSKENLESLDQTTGTIELTADGKSLSTAKLLYNIEEIEHDPMSVDQFEGYLGKANLLLKEWTTNAGTGCSVSPELTREYKAEGEYGMAFNYHITSSGAGEGWAGTTKPMEANWSSGNALQLWIKPDGKGQKLVIQLTSNGEDFEVFLPEFAATKEARYVTVPFATLTGKNGGRFDPSRISSFGIWCNTIGKTDIDSVMYIDDIHAVQSDAASVSFGDSRTEPPYAEASQGKEGRQEVAGR